MVAPGDGAVKGGLPLVQFQNAQHLGVRGPGGHACARLVDQGPRTGVIAALDPRPDRRNIHADRRLWPLLAQAVQIARRGPARKLRAQAAHLGLDGALVAGVQIIEQRAQILARRAGLRGQGRGHQRDGDGQRKRGKGEAGHGQPHIGTHSGAIWLAAIMANICKVAG